MFQFGQWEEAQDPKLWESSIYGDQISPSTSKGGVLPVLKNIVESVIGAAKPVYEEYRRYEQAKEAAGTIPAATPVTQTGQLIIPTREGFPWTSITLIGGGIFAIMMLKKKRSRR